jgi:predicted CopG family antitoxin
MTDITTIQINKSTRDKLKELGTKGESYDDIILRLIN